MAPYRRCCITIGAVIICGVRKVDWYKSLMVVSRSTKQKEAPANARAKANIYGHARPLQRWLFPAAANSIAMVMFTQRRRWLTGGRSCAMIETWSLLWQLWFGANSLSHLHSRRWKSNSNSSVATCPVPENVHLWTMRRRYINVRDRLSPMAFIHVEHCCRRCYAFESR